MRYSHIFFDLDGTLIDSAEGITNSVRYALKKLGIEPPPANRLTPFIGPPLTDSFSRFFGMDKTQSLLAVDCYREYFGVRGKLECRVYDGIWELLGYLRNQGIPCVLATCKPHLYASDILQNKGLAPYFTLVSGPEMDGTRGTKAEVIAYAAERLGISDLSNALMVGDRDSDILGAQAHGMDTAGALWGFGSREELWGATFLCRTPMEVLEFLQK